MCSRNLLQTIKVAGADFMEDMPEGWWARKPWVSIMYGCRKSVSKHRYSWVY